MDTTVDRPNKIHQGRNVKRFRELRGMKQDGLAIKMGKEWNQKRISLLEQRETLADDVLSQVAKGLDVPVDFLKNFNEETEQKYFNSFNDSSVNNGAVFAFDCTFNPLDKFLEVLEENKKLQEEAKQLYERLCASEREKNDLLISTNKTLQDTITELKK